MEILRDVKDDIPFIYFCGEITALDAPSVKQVFNDLIKEGKFNVVLDLGKASSIDGTGISSIVGGFTALRKHNGTLKILSPSSPIRSTFKQAGLSRFFDIFEDEFEVLFSFQS